MIKIDVDDSAIRAALSDLGRRVNDPRPALAEIGEEIVERAKQRFATSSGPDGTPWKPNARATIEAYIAKKGGYGKRGINKKGIALAIAKKPLIGESRDLSRQIAWQLSGNTLTIASTPIYAAIQQFGGQAGRGRRVTIPARPFLPLRSDGNLYPGDRDRILAVLRDHLTPGA